MFFILFLSDVKYLLEQNAHETKLSPSGAGVQEFSQSHPHKLSCNSLKRLATSDIWSASAEQVWLEFLGAQNNKNRPAPFVEAVPVTLWLCVTPNVPSSQKCTYVASYDSQNNAQHVGQRQEGQNGEYSKQGTQSSGNASVGQVAGSSPPVSDRVSSSHANDKSSHSPSHQYHSRHHDSADPQFHDSDHSGDGNSYSHPHQQHRARGDDLRPSKLSLSERNHGGDGSRSRTYHTKSDPHGDVGSSGELANVAYSKKSHSNREQRHQSGDREYSTSDSHKARRSSADYESRNFSESFTKNPNTDIDFQEARQRRETQFRREDSRSSSSPPLLQTEQVDYRRDERKGKERRQRHSSSSDRRDTEGRGRRNREHDPRYGADGRLNSDAFRNGGERRAAENIKRGDDYYTSGDVLKVQMAKRRGREDEMSEREVSHSQSYRRSRHSSSSGSDIGTSGSRDRRQHRAGSRDAKGSMYERYVEEAERYPTRNSHKSERERAPREEIEQQSSKDNQGRRSTRDGNRESSGERCEWSDGHSFERASFTTKKRDQLDGIQPCRRDRPHDQMSNGVSAAEDKIRHSGRRQRSDSRSREPDVRSQKREREEELDNYRSRHHSDDPDIRSRLEEAARPRHAFADCDNDRFSHTSHSSLDTLGRDSLQSAVTSDTRPIDHELSRQTLEDPSQWPEDGTDQTWTQSNQRLPPEGCKSQDDVCYHQEVMKNKPQLEADKKICVLSKLSGKLRVQLNHFQYLFLMRLGESFAAFQTDLSADLLSICSTSKKSHLKKPVKPQPSPIIIIPLVLKELEFAVVCPYQMHQRTFSDDFSMVSPFLQGMSSGQDAVFGDEGDGTCFPQLVDAIRGKSYA